MNKSNKFIWLNSFATDEEAPKCPKDISEPAWAQLLYSPFCQVRCVVPPSVIRRAMSLGVLRSGCSSVILRERRTYTGSRIAGCAKNAFQMRKYLR